MTTTEKLTELNPYMGKCESCEANPAEPDHTCPFAEEIHGNYSICTCCSKCEYQCAMDI